MFGKKKNVIIDKKDDLKVHLTVIPEIFYGGKDPLIYSEQKANKIEKKKPFDAARDKPEKQVKIVPPFSKKKVIVIISVLLGLAAGGGAWYYFDQPGVSMNGILVKLGLKREAKIFIPTPPKLPAPKPLAPTPPEPVLPQPILPEPTIPTSTQARPLTFPSILLKDSSDLDKDSLTDLEEEILNTDSGVWDSDNDGYYDGQEVSNLYNPTGFAPVKLVDSGLVREYVNPNWKYRIYYPASWAEASVDSSNDHVLFSSITGDFVEVRAIKNDLAEPFDAWFVKNIIDQRFTDLTIVKNRFGVEFRKRSDSLAAYFIGNKVIFVVIYQPSGSAEDLPFRHITQMMYQSFRLGDIGFDLPEQKILPTPVQ